MLVEYLTEEAHYDQLLSGISRDVATCWALSHREHF